MSRKWAIGLAAWLAFSAAGATELTPQQAHFVTAEKALLENDSETFKALSESLIDYPLYPYLRYADLRQRLDQVTPVEARNFLARYHDTPLSWQFRRRWLNQLADKQQWDDFLNDYRPTKNVELQCHQLTALIATGKADKALAKTEALWLHGKSRPKACDPAFTHWQKAGNPSPAIAWQRIHLAMRAGNLSLARYLRGLLPSAEQPWVDHWLALYEHPEQLATLTAPGKHHSYLRRMQSHTLERLASRDAPAALSQWQAWDGKLRFGAVAKRRVTWRLAVNLFDEPGLAAAEFFDRLQPGSGDTKMQALRLRATLQRGKWQSYLDQLEQLPPAMRNTSHARYWKARALGETSRTDEANALYRRVAEDRSYHGFLAADRLGLPYQLSHSSAPASAEELANLTADPALLRSRELFALGRLTEARREWRLGTRKRSQSELISAAKLAESWGWHDQAIMTIAQGRYWDDLQLRFPLAYRDAVEAQAERQSIDPAWVYAVVRQESAFMHDASSRVGATGLMQLMPATARRVAQRLPEPIRISTEKLRRPTLNITLGSAYLREVLDGLYDNRVLATAAYNAGPHRVQRWLPDQPMAADLWVEMVPFGETRKYLQRVLSYTAIYQSRLGQQPARLSDHMPVIQPAESYARSLAAKQTSS